MLESVVIVPDPDILPESVSGAGMRIDRSFNEPFSLVSLEFSLLLAFLIFSYILSSLYLEQF